MIPYFNFTYPWAERLMADCNKSFGERETFSCPISPTHNDGDRRISPLYLEVKHNRRDEQIIWGGGCAIHESILAEFEKESFTGYRVKPATVRFQDGTVSEEYHEFIVTGWAGVMSPESGVHVVKSCPGCHWKVYSPITNYEKIIDWSQWTGEDFFIVAPLSSYRLCTERVANWLRKHKVKSFRLENGFAEREGDSIISKLSLPGVRLSAHLPEDLAIKYGRPLGLE
jgi:hypothetical protein